MFDASQLHALVWLTATQFGLYTLGWLACAGLVRDERGAAAAWAVFNLLACVGLLLVSTRDDTRAWASYTGSNLATLGAFAALVEGVRRFVGQPHRWIPWVIVAVGALALLAVGSSAHHAQARVVVSYAAMTCLIVHQIPSVVWEPNVDLGRGKALVIVPALITATMFGGRALQQLLSDVPLEMHQGTAANVEMLFAYLIGSALFNFGCLGLVVLRLVMRLRAWSHHDALTALPNRRAFDDVLARAWSRASRRASPMSIVVIDVDHFKSINDQHGHALGDRVLVEVAARLRANVREGELVARLGGEEFVVILPTAALPHAQDAAERLRSAIAAMPVMLPDSAIDVRVSLGVATSHHLDTSGQSLLVRADQALYAAKRGGRNCVRCAERVEPADIATAACA